MKRNNYRQSEEKKEFTEKVLEINRVTRVVKGGKRMRFRALVVIGDGKNRVGWGIGKAADVSGAISKAVVVAKKQLVTIVTNGSTIPHPIQSLHKGAHVLLKPATPGTGIIAGGSMRTVLRLTSIKDIVCKMLGSQNKINNTMATVQALAALTDPKELDKVLSRNKKPVVDKEEIKSKE